MVEDAYNNYFKTGKGRWRDILILINISFEYISYQLLFYCNFSTCFIVGMPSIFNKRQIADTQLNAGIINPPDNIAILCRNLLF